MNLFNTRSDICSNMSGRCSTYFGIFLLLSSFSNFWKSAQMRLKKNDLRSPLGACLSTTNLFCHPVCHTLWNNLHPYRRFLCTFWILPNITMCSHLHFWLSFLQAIENLFIFLFSKKYYCHLCPQVLIMIILKYQQSDQLSGINW